MKTILHLGKFYPPELGGIESVTASLAKGAALSGYDVSVLCFSSSKGSTQSDGHVRIIRTKLLRKISSQPLNIQYIAQGISLCRRVDIVHMHAPNMLAALICLFIPKKTKVVVHWHSDVVNKGILQRITNPIVSALLNRADKIICTSDAYSVASIPIKKHNHKTVTVPIGAPDPKALPLASRRSTTNPESTNLFQRIGDRPIILCVGRLVPYKGYDTLLDAAALMSKDAVIVIVGGGPLEEALQSRVSSDFPNDRVILAGRLDDMTLQIAFSRARIFCLPSIERSEAFGVVLIEAMSWGIPIVATNIDGSGVPWVNSHLESGLNVAPAHPQELAAALDRLLCDDALRHRLSCGARERFERLFTEEKSIASVLGIYKQLLGS